MAQDTELQDTTVEGDDEARDGESTQQEVESLDEEVDALKVELELSRQALEEQQGRVTQLEAELTVALDHYRDALLTGAPDVPNELVQGDTVEALVASFAQAKALVERVHQQVEVQMARERVPAGSPPRRGVDLSALSSHEKILMGLRQIQQG